MLFKAISICVGEYEMFRNVMPEMRQNFKYLMSFLNYLKPFSSSARSHVNSIFTYYYDLNLSDKSTNFCEWLSAWKSQIHMLLRLELRLEISIKYNLSITFAPKNIVSPRLTFSLVFFLFFTFIFIYLFCIVFELLPLLNELRFGKFIFKPFYGWFFYAPQPHYTIASAVPRFSLT